MTNSESNKALLSEFLVEVWNSGNVDASDKYIAARYTIHHDPGDPWDKQQLNLAQYKDRVRVSRAPFPDQRFTVQEMIAESDKVFITWLWNATHQGDVASFPATGKPITMSGATVYYFDAGRLTGHWQITDRLGVFMQLRQGMAGA